MEVIHLNDARHQMLNNICLSWPFFPLVKSSFEVVVAQFLRQVNKKKKNPTKKFKAKFVPSSALRREIKTTDLYPYKTMTVLEVGTMSA